MKSGMGIRKNIVVLLFVLSGIVFPTATKSQTYCNPMSLGFPVTKTSSVPNLADPTIVLFKDSYFLFATNAGGYWKSTDLQSWNYLEAPLLPLEKEKPTATVIGDYLYFFTSHCDSIFRSKDPANGQWEFYSKSILLPEITDYAIFADTDGKVYSYYGCSNNDGVMSRELDPKDLLKPIKTPVVCQKSDLKSGIKRVETKPVMKHGTYVQGSWMNKYKGKYYYQTLEKVDNQDYPVYMVFVSDNPQGPFKFAASNPFAYRGGGFVITAGSGSTFEDKYGNWWHVATVASPAARNAKSALALFPAGFDKDGNLFVQTDYGDFPTLMPAQKIQEFDQPAPKWILLTDVISTKASSESGLNKAASAFDENLNTYWSALTGKKGEWLSVDLGSVCTVNAIQVSMTKTKVSGEPSAFQYLLEYSDDNKTWKKLSDHSGEAELRTNNYEELKTPVQTRYLRISNPVDSKDNFAVAEFRIFGVGVDRKLKKISEFKAARDYKNPQQVKVFWSKQAGASGYNIRYGIEKDKLYHSYQVYKINKATLPVPDKKGNYWIEVDAFNKNGVTPGKPMMIK